MGLLSFLKRKDAAPETPGSRRKRPAATPSPDAVQQARTRARQRLIGAAVLLGIGVIGFPLLFETQPRPIPVDLPIEVPRRDAVAPLVVPPPERPASPARAAPDITAPTAVIDETPEQAGISTTPPGPSASDPGAMTAAGSDTSAKSEERKPPVVASAASKPATAVSRSTSATEASRAKALLEGKPTAPDAGRFVIQVGAFGEPDAARQARAKVEKLGLKTYTQVVETSGGKRIRVRVGPFSSKEAAQQAASKLKSAGLAGNVLTL